MNLQEQQSKLLHGLFDSWDAVQASTDLASSQCLSKNQYLRGLQAYRSNGTILAARILSDVYPTLKRLMGDEQFEGLAKHLWRIRPPARGDLAQWGEALIEFLRSQRELMAHEPWLADIAELEWAMHTAQTAADADENSPAPFAVIESAYNIVACVNSQAEPAVQDVHATLTRALVYRLGFRVACVELPPDMAL